MCYASCDTVRWNPAYGTTSFRTDPMWFTDYMRRETVAWEPQAAEAAE